MTEHQSRTFRPHISKEERLPRCYKDTEKVLKVAKSCQANAKTVLYNSKFRGAHFQKVYALTFNILKYSRLLENILKNTQLLEKEVYLRKETALIMIYEIVLGKGSLPGKSKPVITIMKYEKAIKEAFHHFQNEGSFIPQTLPRYARVHTLVTTVSDVLRSLEDWGFQQNHYEESISEDNYFDLVQNLQTGYFLIDYHFKDLLVFASNENVTSLPPYQIGHLFLQDKSSYIPVHVLDPKPGCTVLDACAAPGMKTAHLTALMKNEGWLYAYERDKERFITLENMIEFANIKICKPFCDDFRSADPYEDKYSYVSHILLDPSCSGSGMVSRMDFVTDTENSKNVERLQKLAGFQIVLLKHALLFPKVKKVVYSTCSVTEEENEYVVHEALKCFSHSFKLVNVMPEWPVRGSENYEYGSLCLRSFPEKNLTNGFFVAMFERIEPDQERNSPQCLNLLQMSNSTHTLLKSKKDSKYKKQKSNFFDQLSNSESSMGMCEKSHGNGCLDSTTSDKKIKKRNFVKKIEIADKELTNNTESILSHEEKSFEQCEERKQKKPLLEKNKVKKSNFVGNAEALKEDASNNAELILSYEEKSHKRHKEKKRKRSLLSEDEVIKSCFVENFTILEENASNKSDLILSNEERSHKRHKVRSQKGLVLPEDKVKESHLVKSVDILDGSALSNAELIFGYKEKSHKRSKERKQKSSVLLEDNPILEIFPEISEEKLLKKKCKKKHKTKDKGENVSVNVASSGETNENFNLLENSFKDNVHHLETNFPESSNHETFVQFEVKSCKTNHKSKRRKQKDTKSVSSITESLPHVEINSHGNHCFEQSLDSSPIKKKKKHKSKFREQAETVFPNTEKSITENFNFNSSFENVNSSEDKHLEIKPSVNFQEELLQLTVSAKKHKKKHKKKDK